MSDKKTYPAYAGLDRTAAIWGIPLMPLLAIVCTAVILAVVGGAVFGPGGLLFGVPAIPVLLFFKHICETDDQALRILFLEVRCVLDRRNTKCFGNTYTLTPLRYGRQLADAARGFVMAAKPTFVSRAYARLAKEKRSYVHQ